MHRVRCLRIPKEIQRRRRNCTDGSVLVLRLFVIGSQAFTRRVPNAAVGYCPSPQPRGKSNARHRGSFARPSTEHPNYSKSPCKRQERDFENFGGLFILQYWRRRDNHLQCFQLHKAESRRSTSRLHVRKARSLGFCWARIGQCTTSGSSPGDCARPSPL